MRLRCREGECPGAGGIRTQDTGLGPRRGQPQIASRFPSKDLDRTFSTKMILSRPRPPRCKIEETRHARSQVGITDLPQEYACWRERRVEIVRPKRPEFRRIQGQGCKCWNEDRDDQGNRGNRKRHWELATVEGRIGSSDSDQRKARREKLYPRLLSTSFESGS